MTGRCFCAILACPLVRYQCTHCEVNMGLRRNVGFSPLVCAWLGMMILLIVGLCVTSRMNPTMTGLAHAQPMFPGHIPFSSPASEAAARAAKAEQARRQHEAQRLENERLGNELAAKMVYFRNPRTGLCYSYMWVTEGYLDNAVGGPSHAPEDCAKVKALLLNPPPQ